MPVWWGSRSSSRRPGKKERTCRQKKGVFHYPLELVICFSSITLSIYHLFVAYAGSLEAHAFRSTHLAFVLILCFLMRPLGHGDHCRLLFGANRLIGSLFRHILRSAQLLVHHDRLSLLCGKTVFTAFP
jgi:TRAP-type uncharacterized transport system fused permease subunit